MFNNKNINVFYMLLSIIFIGIIIFFIINYKNVVDIVYFFVIFIIGIKTISITITIICILYFITISNIFFIFITSF